MIELYSFVLQYLGIYCFPGLEVLLHSRSGLLGKLLIIPFFFRDSFSSHEECVNDYILCLLLKLNILG